MAAGKRYKKNQSGYTLLEVTVALIIIGITLAVLLGQLSRSKSLSFKADLMIESVRILNNLAEDSVLIKKAVRNGEEEGNVPDESGWLYSIKAQPLEIQLKPDDEELVEIPGMEQLRICITKSQGNSQSNSQGSHGRKYCTTRWYRAK